MADVDPRLSMLEARTLCNCTLDSVLAAASTGELKAYVIGQDWPVTPQRGKEPVLIDEYVELPTSVMRKARGADYVKFKRGTLPSGDAVEFAQEYTLGFGAVWMLREEVEKFKAEHFPSVEPVPQSPVPEAPPSLGPLAELGVSATVGLLAHFIAHSSGKPKHLSDGEPNALQLAQDLEQFLLSKKLETKGFAVITLQKRILEGLKAFKERLE